MADNNSSGIVSAPPIKIENIGLPGFGPADAGELNLEKYRVRYGKYDLDNPGSVTELEILETEGLRGKEIVVLNKDKFTFLEAYYIVVTYLELIQTTDNQDE